MNSRRKHDIRFNRRFWDHIDEAYDYIIEKTVDAKRGDSVVLTFSIETRLDSSCIPYILFATALGYKKTGTFVSINGLGEDDRNFLNEVGFHKLNYINNRSLRLRNHSSISNLNVMIPVTKISENKKFEDLILDFKRDIKNFKQIPADLCQAIIMIVFEIGSNVFDHAFLADVVFYTCVQVEGNSVKIVMQDTGMGFYENLDREFSGKIKDSKDALKKAVIDGWCGWKVAGSRVGSGNAYTQIKEILNQYSGELTIYSGQGKLTYWKNNDFEIRDMKKQLEGANIFLNLEF